MSYELDTLAAVGILVTGRNDWAIISAERAEFNDDENEMRSEALRLLLQQNVHAAPAKNGPRVLIPLRGVYKGGSEQSFFAYPIEPETALRVGRAFSQESVLLPAGLVWSDESQYVPFTQYPAQPSFIAAGTEVDYKTEFPDGTAFTMPLDWDNTHYHATSEIDEAEQTYRMTEAEANAVKAVSDAYSEHLVAGGREGVEHVMHKKQVTDALYQIVATDGIAAAIAFVQQLFEMHDKADLHEYFVYSVFTVNQWLERSDTFIAVLAAHDIELYRTTPTARTEQHSSPMILSDVVDADFEPSSDEPRGAYDNEPTFAGRYVVGYDTAVDEQLALEDTLLGGVPITELNHEDDAPETYTEWTNEEIEDHDTWLSAQQQQ